MLFEASSVDQSGLVNQSCIGANTHIAKGEVTASFVGPFVGMHHQSLLIGTLWPEGRGNIGYGANVGSNHTGRAPDQEFWAAEGEFFGLSASIKFPAMHRDAAYSLVASGIMMPIGKIEFPFSLICDSLSESKQACAIELVPAWMLLENRYSLIRSTWKFRHRNHAKHYELKRHYLNSTTIQMVLSALLKLEALPEKNFYSLCELNGPKGISFSYESCKKAMVGYREAIELFLLGTKYQLPEFEQFKVDDHWMVLLQKARLPNLNEVEGRIRLRALKRHEYELAFKSKEKDRVRGRKITPEYDLYHLESEMDACLLELKAGIDQI